MISNLIERAVHDATRHGNALLKFISANDAGATGAHQAGFYLPKAAWRMYSSHPPTKGAKLDDSVEIQWPDDRITQSRVTWYGDRTRSEYRLTRFGKDFPFLRPDRVGDLLVLIPSGKRHFRAYVFGSEEEIAEILSALGLELAGGWGVYKNGAAILEDPAECEERETNRFTDSRQTFPSGDIFSDRADEILDQCYPRLRSGSPDARLVKAMEIEYRLFKSVETKLCTDETRGPFDGIDDFLRVAATIMNRRKARAGRSLENHIGKALEQAGIQHDFRARDIQGVPDIVIPGVAQYQDPAFPRNKVFVLAAKTTCKDRWRQVLDEGPLVDRKFLITLQPGVSDAQVGLMVRANVQLVVPESLHAHYAPEARRHLVTLSAFFETVQRSLDP